MIFDPLLSHLQEKVSNWETFLQSGVTDDFPYFAFFAFDKVINETESVGLYVVEVLVDTVLDVVDVFLYAWQNVS